MSKTNFSENAFLGYMFAHVGSLTQPANWFIGLFSASPGEGTPVNELSGGGYARVQVQNISANWTNQGQQPQGLTFANTNTVTFPQATAAWAQATNFGLFDALTGGNLWWSGPLDTPTTIAIGDTARFDPGQLRIAEA